MAETLRVLIIDDNDDEAQLELRRLRDAGYAPQWERVDTMDALRDALREQEWDVALVDYTLPGFSGPDALRLVAELAPDLPAITVTGTIDEDIAVDTLRAGALDYVLKDNLRRLAPAVERVLAEAETRRRHRQVAETAKLALFALDTSVQAILAVVEDGSIVYANEAAARLTGRSRESLVGVRVHTLVPAADEGQWRDLWEQTRRERSSQFEVSVPLADGRDHVLRVLCAYIEHDGRGHAVVFGLDITEQEDALRGLRESEEQFRRFAAHLPGYLGIRDADLRYRLLDGQGIHEHGLTEKDWRGRTPRDLWPDEGDRLDRLHAAALAGHTVGELDVWPIGDEERIYHTVHFPLARDDGTVEVGLVGVDVTEREQARERLRRSSERLQRTLEGAVSAMSAVVETRDPYTAGHERRVAQLAAALAAHVGLRDDEVAGVRLAGQIHDIGKIAVPAEILTKPSRLTAVEFNLIKAHPQAGHDIISTIEWDQPVAEVVLQHHERLDGSGYPRGLAGDDILAQVRILAVADVVEAMSSHRPYRPALGVEAALAEIRDGAGARYDTDVAAACERLFTSAGFAFED